MTRRQLAAGLAGTAGLIAVVTLLARVAGLTRVLGFAVAVRAGGVGEIYHSVNAVPTMVFEVAAGGTLAAVAVPLIAHRIGAGEPERADALASVLLSWTVAILVPLGAVVFLFAAPLATFLVDDFDPQARSLAATLLRIFALQVPLYGVGIVLTGLLHAHRRFLAAALAPLCSSVVVLGSYLWYGYLTGGQTSLSLVSDGAVAVLGWGTTVGVVALALPLVGPALATGWRWRPTWWLDADDARRIGRLAGAGGVALLAQQGVVLTTIWLSNRSGDRGTLPVYGYVQAMYLLPYAVLAVPVATSVVPALATRAGADAGTGDGADADSATTLARSIRAVLVLTGLSAGALVAAAPAVGAFFGILDQWLSLDGASTAALDAMPVALTAYAPGLVGFGLIALLTRATYVRGQPLHAAAVTAFGWGVAAVPPVAIVGTGQGAATTLWSLGVASSAGMTIAGIGLVVLVRRAWGAPATAGAARTAGTVVVAVAMAVAAGDLVTRGRPLDDLTEVLVVGVAAGATALLAGLVAFAVGDRTMLANALRRGRARRRTTVERA
ncbi:MAG: murein biosynthesis integral membrane protein MurJ [Dermatophilaceae bacterium]